MDEATEDPSKGGNYRNPDWQTQFSQAVIGSYRSLSRLTHRRCANPSMLVHIITLCIGRCATSRFEMWDDSRILSEDSACLTSTHHATPPYLLRISNGKSACVDRFGIVHGYRSRQTERWHSLRVVFVLTILMDRCGRIGPFPVCRHLVRH